MSHAKWIRLAAIVVLLQGCSFQHFDNLDSDGDEVDFSSFGGVSIVGEMTVGKSEPKTEDLMLDRLQAAMLSVCMDELESNDPGYTELNCSDTKLNLSSTGPSTGPRACRRRSCLNMLYVCAGYKALELAEAVDITSFSTQVVAFSATMNGDYISVDITQNQARESDSTTYRIPPLSSEAKTLALLSANAMFRAAGLEAAKIPTTVWVNTTNCLDYLYDQSQLEAGPKNADFSSTALDRYVMGLSESVARLVEATQKLVENQLNVGASAIAKQADQQEAQEQLWKGAINSQTAALRNLIGDPHRVVEFQGCRTELYKPAHDRALKLLRVTRLNSTYASETTVDTDTVIKEMICVLAPNDPLDPDYQEDCPENPAVLASTVVDSFLDANNIDAGDVALARKYLLEEKLAVGIRISVESGTQPVQVHSAAPQTGARPAAYFIGKTSGSVVILGGGQSEEDQYRYYAGRGTVPALDFIRRAINAILVGEASDDLLTVDQELLLTSSSTLVNKAVGTERIVVRPNSTSDFRPNVRVYGTAWDEVPESFLFLNGEDGFLCLFDGTIGGAPCDIDDYLIEPTSPGPNCVPTARPRGLLDSYCNFAIREGTGDDFKEIFVVKKDGTNGNALLGIFNYNAFSTVPVPIAKAATTPHRIFLPVVRNSVVGDMVARISTRPPGRCSEPREMCGDIGLPRDYIPTLENEITESLGAGGAGDSYENSWVHYLNLARDAADRADALGDQLVQAGLEGDLRSEQAQREVEKICGGVFNFDTPQGLSLGSQTIW